MARHLLGIALALTLASCGSGPTPVGPEPSRSATGGALLAVEDLPDGYVTSPPQVEPEVSGDSTVSVAGCGALIDRFRGGGTGVRFEGGSAGPFLAEEVSADPDAVDVLRELGTRCAAFTDTDPGGGTTSVTVTDAGLPSLGDESAAVRMAASGGAGDDAYTLGGYLLVVRVGGATCTLVHFGQPEVDRAETETIAKAAVRKLRRPQ
ncbi:hypothetical protein [Dactylosporangium sp. NPDC050588]|uniref:hypothetical protein n=1 Tax=Dactylosporangium sp. NPDC050588 TaxID=3157211 RepID=UPI0033CB2DD4